MYGVTLPNGKEYIFMSLESVKFWATRKEDNTENPLFIEMIQAARELLAVMNVKL